MLAEVILRAGFEAVDAVPEVNLVGVHGEDLLLGKSAFNLDRKNRLLNFAAKAALRRKKEVSRQLHGERGGSLCAGLCGCIAIGGAENPPEVDAPVAIEVLVFGGDDRVA